MRHEFPDAWLRTRAVGEPLTLPIKKERLPYFLRRAVARSRRAHGDPPANYAEQAIYVVEGRLDLGADGRHEAGRLLVLKPQAKVMLAASDGPVRMMLLGGEPMDGPRYLSWNFAATSAERIEKAKRDWRDRRFAAVPGETEFIPLPDIPGKPVHYP